jgi:hypothetical protein
MTIVVTRFSLPAPLTNDEVKPIFLSTAPLYQGRPGLLRKHYLLSDDGRTAGAVYLWQSRSEAEKCYSSEWRQFVTEKYGSEPSVTFFENLVTVDNVTGASITQELRLASET